MSVVAVLLCLEARHRKLFLQAEQNGSSRIDVVPDLLSGALKVEAAGSALPRPLQSVVGNDGRLLGDDPEQALEVLRRAQVPELRISQEVEPWLEAKQLQEERIVSLREYEQRVQSGEWPAQETLVPLYPYQREGMLHLAFKERALLADEMGLGKTIQAIAACALLHRLGKASRVLVVTPASLKTEWEEQIQRFTELPYQLVFGPRQKRLRLYASAPFFTIVNYEQMLADSLDVNAKLRPDIVILDEAQRIKNWSTKTAQAVKRLRSRHAFVLTGTQIGYALHTGSVPQRRRRAEILLFKNDPNCRVFLSTDSGSTGLNLQNASVVINCDLPWNPARLEQRIARAWRKHQARSVTVINLVSEGTIEHRMLGTLSAKQALADGVLDLRGDLGEIKFRGGRQAFLERLHQLMAPAQPAEEPVPARKPLPADRALAFSQIAREQIGDVLVRCEERYPLQGAHSVLVAVVERDSTLWQAKLAPLHEELFGKNGPDPLAPTRLEVIDRATEEALQRLIAAGLLTPATRAIRELYPAGTNAAAELSEEEREKALAHRQQASRKLKMAHLLDSGGLLEEGREALLQSALLLAKALAVENRAPEPADLSNTFQAPASLHWGESLPMIRDFASAQSAPLSPVAEALQTLLGTG